MIDLLATRGLQITKVGLILGDTPRDGFLTLDL